MNDKKNLNVDKLNYAKRNKEALVKELICAKTKNNELMQKISMNRKQIYTQSNFEEEVSELTLLLEDMISELKQANKNISFVIKSINMGHIVYPGMRSVCLENLSDAKEKLSILRSKVIQVIILTQDSKVVNRQNNRNKYVQILNKKSKEELLEDLIRSKKRAKGLSQFLSGQNLQLNAQSRHVDRRKDLIALIKNGRNIIDEGNIIETIQDQINKIKNRERLDLNFLKSIEMKLEKLIEGEFELARRYQCDKETKETKPDKIKYTQQIETVGHNFQRQAVTEKLSANKIIDSGIFPKEKTLTSKQSLIQQTTNEVDCSPERTKSRCCTTF